MNLFNQANLFEKDEPTIRKWDMPQGDVTLYEHFFSKAESDLLYTYLINNIAWKQDQLKIYGKAVDLPRLTAWYGDRKDAYAYSGITMHQNQWTKELLFIKARVEKESGLPFSGVLLNYYRNGKDSVSWHSDDEKMLGKNPVIGSVTFGETRVFQMRHRNNKQLKVNIPLTHGSFLLMKGTTQLYWEHQIPKTAKNIGGRINLTFRIVTS